MLVPIIFGLLAATGVAVAMEHNEDAGKTPALKPTSKGKAPAAKKPAKSTAALDKAIANAKAEGRAELQAEFDATEADRKKEADIAAKAIADFKKEEGE